MPNFKLLFVDVDGVLNTSSSRENAHRIRAGDFGTHRAWVPECVGQLKRVIAETGCSLVISSDWRLPHIISDLKEGFEHFQLPAWIGTTPDLHRSNRHNGGRGLEIESFLNQFTTIQPDGHQNIVAAFAIVDDNPWMLPSQAPNFVQTDEWFGLTTFNADILIKILNHA